MGENAETQSSSAEVGAAIRTIRQARRLTLEDVALAMGTDTGNLSRLERGLQAYTTTTLDAAARALGVEVRDFFVRQDSPGYKVDPHTYRVPVVGTAQLGDDGFWHEYEYPTGHGEGYVVYPTKDPNCYAVRVKGDSMRPRIKPGEFVVIEPNTTINQGDEVLVRVRDGRKMIKILHSRRDGMVELYSVNEAHRPITLDDQQIESMHFVAGILKASLYHRDVT